MSSDFVFWLALALKLVLTAGIVVTASFVTERAGPLIGALVVTLPVTVWPAYVFLSLDHDATFIAESVVGGLAMNAVSGIFMLIYIVLAQRRGLAVSLLTALASWLILAVLARFVAWTATISILANIVVYTVCILLTRRFRDVVIPPTVRKWYDLSLRTLLVCTLMGTVLVISNIVGPIATGFVAVFPISTTCTMLILQPRIGGPASAAVITNGLFGLAGIGAGLVALHFSIAPLGMTLALVLLLAVPVTWNLTVWAVRMRVVSFRRRRPYISAPATASISARSSEATRGKD
ncbi:MAG: hypothetical protein HYX37_07625 [Rhizobiales bacterium]|nr:hypothetical protein [Hyphomicrobiales bacterium]